VFSLGIAVCLTHFDLPSQGTYTKPGSIVVLCMYLGQLAKIRDEFRDSKISVVLDSRDEEVLRDREGDVDTSEEEPIVEVAEVKVTDQVQLLSSRHLVSV
jgi:hypothetical protein